MKIDPICRNNNGATAVEFALTMPVFFALIFGAIQVALLLWTQAGLQRGAEMAARCATVSTTKCFDATSIQKYAAQQAMGLNVSSQNFQFSTPACGNQVSASYTFSFLAGFLPTMALSAQACFPK
jgi:Flp pilus assembly protein TadG